MRRPTPPRLLPPPMRMYGKDLPTHKRTHSHLLQIVQNQRKTSACCVTSFEQQWKTHRDVLCLSRSIGVTDMLPGEWANRAQSFSTVGSRRSAYVHFYYYRIMSEYSSFIVLGFCPRHVHGQYMQSDVNFVVYCVFLLAIVIATKSVIEIRSMTAHDITCSYMQRDSLQVV